MDLIDVYDDEYKLVVEPTDYPDIVEITATMTGQTHVTVDVRMADLEDALIGVRASHRVLA